MPPDAVAELGLRVGLHIGAEQRELDHVEERRQGGLAIVEFMVAERHGVELHLVEEFAFNLALVGRVEQRALEIVAGAEQQHVLAFELLALLADRGDQPARAPDAFALGLLLGRAGRLVFVVAFDAAVPVVDVQDVQRVVGKGCASRQAERGGRKGGNGSKSLHLRLPES